MPTLFKNQIIEVDKVSKRYFLDHQRKSYVALRDVISQTFLNPLKIIKSDKKEEFWALKDVSFTISRGEAVGVIGANGSGKSTLLKILTGIVYPTTGQAKIYGKVASLLEVGTGFHPELTGRENIFLNGAILGMSQREIRKNFDAIVDFSGVEKFLDTPVKHYSSGMYVRLAFSVAAHLSPDVLLIDEVLAVGDAAFQKKCLGKMDEVTKSQGRTVLFVSHNMNAVASLCNRAILLEEGKIKMFDETKLVIERYLNGSRNDLNIKNISIRKGDGTLRLTNFYIVDGKKKVSKLKTGGNYTFVLEYDSGNGKGLHDVEVSVQISESDGKPVTMFWTKYTDQDFKNLKAKGKVFITIDSKFPIAEGLYNVSARIASKEGVDWVKNFGLIEVVAGDYFGSGFEERHAPIFLSQKWSAE